MAQHMLGTATIMSRTALAFALVAASASVASAGNYVGLGIGTSPATSGEMSYGENGRSGRLVLGHSFGRLAVEGLVSHATLDGVLDLEGNHDWYNGYEVGWTTAGVAGKYNFPLQDKFELFGRVGYQRTWITCDEHPQYPSSWGGGGLFASAGVEYRINVGVAGGSIFMDYTVGRSTMTAEEYPDQEFGMTSRHWTIGATLGF